MHTSARLSNMLGAVTLLGWQRQADVLGGVERMTDGTALALLLERPGQTISELASSLGRTHSATVRVVDRLVEAGVVQRARGVDARTQQVQLTAAGRQRALAYRKSRLGALGELIKDLDEGQQETLATLLAQILASMPRTWAEGLHDCRLCVYPVCAIKGCPVEASMHRPTEPSAWGCEFPAEDNHG